ncbi:hypothetical protein BURCENBC7_AP6042 [Burkholderia cenocepacia BC7]|nr:hypothetical protein BURCENK562V_C6138 [Burkholderia cenocepacia K56-2Valvano]ERI27369.1 hypothetical protein BURCENBC7_AP6042 [Burkholderia cenocepacia BC7]
MPRAEMALQVFHRVSDIVMRRTGRAGLARLAQVVYTT